MTSWGGFVSDTRRCIRGPACADGGRTSCCDGSGGGDGTGADPARTLFVSPVWSGPVNPLTHFTTVAAALAQAASLGPTDDAPVEIFIFTGKYLENLTLISNVDLRAPSSDVRIRGSVTYTPGQGVNAPQAGRLERITIQGVTFNGPAFTVNTTGKPSPNPVQLNVLTTGLIPSTALSITFRPGLFDAILLANASLMSNPAATPVVTGGGALEATSSRFLGPLLFSGPVTVTLSDMGADTLTFQDGPGVLATGVALSGDLVFQVSSGGFAGTLTGTGLTVGGNTTFTLANGDVTAYHTLGTLTVTNTQFRATGHVLGAVSVGASGRFIMNGSELPVVTVAAGGLANVIGSTFTGLVGAGGIDRTAYVFEGTTDVTGNLTVPITPQFIDASYGIAAIALSTVALGVPTTIPSVDPITITSSGFTFHGQPLTVYRFTVTRVSSTLQ